jgi:hypothetical protein
VAAVKLRVQREDGRIETLELSGTWVFRDGKLLSRMTQEDGGEHFFTPEGYYDGWGNRMRARVERPPLVITVIEAKRPLD